ncbi:MAG: GH3 auxin-responsive promoter family protein [Deltaproteobacteria bacterium]
MKIKSLAIGIAASALAGKIGRDKKNAVNDQKYLMQKLVLKAVNTVFGKEHSFSGIRNYQDFKRNIPLRDYEDYRIYIDMIIKGKPDILWPGIPKYFAKTSGTTSGIKYIPITSESMPNHINTARAALLNYFHIKRKAGIFDGKVMFLSGSPVLEKKGPIPAGRLSGIVYHEIPFWVKSNQLPSWETNCIDDWEKKVERIAEETKNQDLRLISGIPPWVQMYFEKLIAITRKKTIIDIFPNLSLFIYGGVNYEPYRSKLREIIGDEIDTLETYPASEGFFAYQDEPGNAGLLLNTNSGIFYEFVPVDRSGKTDNIRIMLNDVETGVDYELIVNSNSGLWGYQTGDLVRFINTDPYKIIVSGRVDHFISAFGEHVIAKEVEDAMYKTASKFGYNILEFTVAPQINPPGNLQPYHEWFIEFADIPENLISFAIELNDEMCRQNIYYNDLIKGKVLQNLKIRMLKKNTFREYMKSLGKLGGQNKVPHLSNNRKIAEWLESFCL